MNLLVITQKIDGDDTLLGFFCGWLKELAKRIDKIYALTLEKQGTDLAKNIELYSLGKENGSNRLRRFFKFNYYLAKILFNKRIDIIFIHMCPEYALLASPYAKIMSVPQVLWYAHGNVNVYLRIAHFLVNKVVSSSKDGFRINSQKLIIVGQGVDVNKFKPQAANPQLQREGKMILSVGRISPIKNYEILIKAANILVNRKNRRDLKFKIVGGVSLRSQKRYWDFLKDMVKRCELEDYVKFVGPVSYTQIENWYQDCDLFVSASNTGSLDKAVLEAMACGKAALTCNEAFSGLLKAYSDILLFDKNDADSLAEKIIRILETMAEDRHNLNNELREIVLRNHTLGQFTDNILPVFKDAIGNN